jgi:hypothetical protein
MMCIADPGSSAIGLAIKVAYMSWRSAASRNVRLVKTCPQTQGLVVQEVDFHLAGAHFVNQGIDFEIHRRAVIVDVSKQRIELADCIDAVVLAAGLCAPAAADRWLEWKIRIDVTRDQIKIELGRDNRLPPFFRIQPNDAA